MPENIHPFIFRGPQRQLYGSHNRPENPAEHSSAILICNSFFHEYERSHKAMRQLAVQLARAGYHVMRFDYYGTGDSAGHGEDGSIVQWQRDTQDASQECTSVSGKNSLALFGIRLGAMLAAREAFANEKVERLVLYAPVVDIDGLFAEWLDVQRSHDRIHNVRLTNGLEKEVLGYPLTTTLKCELREEVIVPEVSVSLRAVLVIYEREGEVDAQLFADALASKGADVSLLLAEEPAAWRREPSEALVPFQLLRNIVSWLKDTEL